MGDETTMIAIEAALRSADTCTCGNGLDIVARDGALWLECRAFTAPSRLPAALALALRTLAHDRSFVAEDRPVTEPDVRAARLVTLQNGLAARA